MVRKIARAPDHDSRVAFARRLCSTPFAWGKLHHRGADEAILHEPLARAMHPYEGMFHLSQIKPHMPVVCSEGGQFAVVDHLEGKDAIKLTKDRNGQHHYIPVSWVRSVDTQVHVDRPGDQAMKEWSSTPPPSVASPRGSEEGTRARMNASAENPLHAERVRSHQEGMEHPERDPERAERLRTSSAKN